MVHADHREYQMLPQEDVQCFKIRGRFILRGRLFAPGYSAIALSTQFHASIKIMTVPYLAQQVSTFAAFHLLLAKPAGKKKHASSHGRTCCNSLYQIFRSACFFFNEKSAILKSL